MRRAAAGSGSTFQKQLKADTDKTHADFAVARAVLPTRRRRTARSSAAAATTVARGHDGAVIRTTGDNVAPPVRVVDGSLRPVASATYIILL